MANRWQKSGGKTAIEIEGLRDVMRMINKVEAGCNDLKDVWRKAATGVERDAEQFVPVRSGRLKASIRSGADKKGGYVRAGNNRKAGPSALPYAPVIHFGWPKRNISPNYFMYRALQKNEAPIVRLIKKEVDRLIAKYGGPRA